MKTYLKSVKNYNSPLYNYLCSLGESQIYSSEHNPPLSHPADILLNQLTNVKQSLVDIKKLKEIGIKNAFGVIDTFFDNCFNILKTLYPPSAINESFAYKWLELNGHNTGKLFRQYSNTLHKFISETTNIIKHDNPKVKFINFTDKYTKNITIEGFYIASVIEDGSLGPDPRIHERYKNKPTAFSYNFIIRKFIGHVFHYEDCLMRALKGRNNFVSSQNTIYKELFDIGMDMDHNMFINEYNINIPTTLFRTEGKNYIIEFPKTLLKYAPKKYSYIMETSVEINSRTKTANGYFPYLGIE